ncbi:hypothetical protein MPH_01311 [Macrophomina phaseolina MS6]|uniref:Xylanolytic transcriptional activator regulatory domain-containing protein n=1 Tax=Macrophomina phaseolina (strain MS6) TaxID=1126212 RepID=K2SFU6_MACPH|nr:hypothetical protein MPH_01311 [Macrophomina phaseolina MS6]
MALLFAISFAATAATSKHEAEEQLGFERLKLLRYFMRRIDGSLAKAKILLYPSIEALQALVIYLSTLRTHDTSRAVWVLGGIAIRLAESLGVHQDGLRLGLSPFEAETRCRLWWIVTALDSSAPEDHGFDSTIADLSQSIRTPLNANDADLFPQMAELPAEKEEWTEMTFSLANLDIHRTLRQTVVASRSKEISEQEKAIQNVQDVIWQRSLRLADPTKPLCQVADAVLRISVLKTLFLCNLRSWLSNSSVRSEASSRYRRLPDKIFIAAVDLLEKVYILQSGRASRGFSWFYQQRPQLYAVFLVLHALKDGPDRLDADRAWRAVDNYSTCLTDFEEAHERKGRTSCVWRILGPLREAARESRRQMANGTFHLHSGEHGPQSSGIVELNNDATGASAMSDSSSRLPESYETLRQADPFAMEGMTFDSILAWQDFSGWFDVGQNTL